MRFTDAFIANELDTQMETDNSSAHAHSLKYKKKIP